MTTKNIKNFIFIMLTFISIVFCAVIIISFSDIDKSTYANTELSAQASSVNIGSYSDFTNFVYRVNNNQESNLDATLTADIDCKGNSTWPIGIVCGYEGEFNGNGYKINNLQITTVSTEVRETEVGTCALFGYCNGATIKQLRLSNITLNLRDGNYDNTYAGGIVAFSNSSTIIKGCMVDNIEIKSLLGDTFPNCGIGGICGNNEGSISSCYAENINISAYYYSNSELYDYKTWFGGISAWGSVSNCVFKPGSSKWIVNVSGKNVKGKDVTQTYKALEDEVFGQNINFWNSENYWYSLNINTFSTESTDCISTATSGMRQWSSIRSSNGGKTYTNGSGDAIYWYYNANFNDGFLCLRIFVDWVKVTAISYDTSQGTVTWSNSSSLSCYMPKGYKIALSDTSNANIVDYYGMYATATANDNYAFDYWENPTDTTKNCYFKAHFKRTISTVTFKNPTDTDSSTEITSFTTKGVTAYELKQNSTITASKTSGNGAFTLTYTFNDKDDKPCSVTYDIPVEYYLSSADLQGGTVTKDIEISPKVNIRTFTITFNDATNASKTGDDSWTVTYNASIEMNEGKKYVEFVYDSKTVRYDANSNCSYDYNISSSDLTNITGNKTISPTFIKWYTVTFNETNNATLSKSFTGSLSVPEYSTITASLSENKKTLTYTYGSNTATYTANKYYSFDGQANDVYVNRNRTIQPTAQNYFCTVTIGVAGTADVTSADKLSELTKSGDVYQIKNINSDIVCTVSVTGDNYAPANDGIFIVEYNKKVEFSFKIKSEGCFEYTYVFKDNDGDITVTYTISNSNYAMQYELEDDGDRKSIFNSLGTDNKTSMTDLVSSADNTTYSYSEFITSETKTITPTFGKKQYNVSLKDK